MKTCAKCKKTLEESFFQKQDKILKTCSICRDKNKVNKIIWGEKNKKRISAYNKVYNSKDKEVITILMRKKGSEDYQKFFSLVECCDTLGLQKSNVCKMLKGGLKSTGGYEGKYGEIEIVKSKSKTWEEVKDEENFNQKIISSKRILHVEKDGVQGKKCCKCKEWKPLSNYNFSKTHWDKLRNDCKDCLVQYRKDNRNGISKKYCEYEKKRKKEDPIFKLTKTLRSRLGNVIKRKNATKGKSTLELTGCELSFLKGYLESKFEEGMTWENHGEWHIDHIKPYSSFNLIDIEEQKRCFHYSNLQPLWKLDNLTKGSKV